MDPNELHVTKGQSVNVTCSWNITDSRRIRVEWRKQKLHTLDENGTLLSSLLWTPSNENIFPQTNKNRSSYIITKDSAVMILESISEEDEGHYICKVVSEIPVLSVGEGNVTLNLFTKVLDRKESLKSLAFIVGVLPVLTLLGCFIYKMKRRPKRRILQKSEQESLELNCPDADRNNDADENSSSNSVTWAVSTVYESFDYFAMKNKDEKATASCDKDAGFLDVPAAYSDQSTACFDQDAACSYEAVTCSD